MRVKFPQGMWIPVKTAAKMLKVSRQRVYELIKDGGLAWCKMDSTVLVSRSSVEARVAWKELRDAS
jgi:excisionase family DNA binding protein